MPILDEQSGERRSAQGGGRQTGERGGAAMGYHGLEAQGFQTGVYFDTGGASRFFPQFKDEAELRDWITRLISRPPSP